jgi:hypothetical protein
MAEDTYSTNSSACLSKEYRSCSRHRAPTMDMYDPSLPRGGRDFHFRRALRRTSVAGNSVTMYSE